MNTSESVSISGVLEGPVRTTGFLDEALPSQYTSIFLARIPAMFKESAERELLSVTERRSFLVPDIAILKLVELEEERHRLLRRKRFFWLSRDLKSRLREIEGQLDTLQRSLIRISSASSLPGRNDTEELLARCEMLFKRIEEKLSEGRD
jgi:hypothetical protein